MKVTYIPTLSFILLLIVQQIYCEEKENAKEEKKAKKIGKDVTDYNEVDVEKLLDQWNDNDDDYDDEDSDDPRKRKEPQIDMSKITGAGGNKEEIMKLTKKGKPMMMFVNVAGTKSKTEAEKISGIWQQGLQNAQIQVQRYMLADNRVLFQLNDGGLAWQIKDYLITQDNCESVTFENMDFKGKGATSDKKKTEL